MVTRLRVSDHDYVAAFRRGLAPQPGRPDLPTTAVRTERGLRLQCQVAGRAFVQLSIGRDRIEVALRDRDVERISFGRRLVGDLGAHWHPAQRIVTNGTSPRAVTVLLRGSMPARGRKKRLLGFERIAELLPSLAAVGPARAALGELFVRATVEALLLRAAQKRLVVQSWLALGGPARVRRALVPFLPDDVEASNFERDLGARGAFRFGRKLLALSDAVTDEPEEVVDARIREAYLGARDTGRSEATDALRAAVEALSACAAAPTDAERIRIGAVAGRRLRRAGRSRGGGGAVLFAAIHLEEARRALLELGNAGGAAWRPRLAWAARELVKGAALAVDAGAGASVHERVHRTVRTVAEERDAVKRETSSRRCSVDASATSVADVMAEARTLDRADEVADRFSAAAEELRDLFQDRLARGEQP